MGQPQADTMSISWVVRFVNFSGSKILGSFRKIASNDKVVNSGRNGG